MREVYLGGGFLGRLVTGVVVRSEQVAKRTNTQLNERIYLFTRFTHASETDVTSVVELIVCWTNL